MAKRKKRKIKPDNNFILVFISKVEIESIWRDILEEVRVIVEKGFMEKRKKRKIKPDTQ